MDSDPQLIPVDPAAPAAEVFGRVVTSEHYRQFRAVMRLLAALVLVNVVLSVLLLLALVNARPDPVRSGHTPAFSAQPDQGKPLVGVPVAPPAEASRRNNGPGPGGASPH